MVHPYTNVLIPEVKIGDIFEMKENKEIKQYVMINIQNGCFKTLVQNENDTHEEYIDTDKFFESVQEGKLYKR